MTVRVAACSVMWGAPRNSGGRVRISWGESSVDVSEGDVDGADDGNDVGDQFAAHHVRQRTQIAEGWRAHLAAIRPRAAVAHQVEAKLAARRLDRLVHLPLGDAHALGDELEVMDERLHAG